MSKVRLKSTVGVTLQCHCLLTALTNTALQSSYLEHCFGTGINDRFAGLFHLVQETHLWWLCLVDNKLVVDSVGVGIYGNPDELQCCVKRIQVVVRVGRRRLVVVVVVLKSKRQWLPVLLCVTQTAFVDLYTDMRMFIHSVQESTSVHLTNKPRQP